MLATWGSFYCTALRVLTLSSLWWRPKHHILGMRTGVIGADPGVRGIRILRPIWIHGDGVNTGLTVENAERFLGEHEGKPYHNLFLRFPHVDKQWFCIWTT